MMGFANITMAIEFLLRVGVNQSQYWGYFCQQAHFFSFSRVSSGVPQLSCAPCQNMQLNRISTTLQLVLKQAYLLQICLWCNVFSWHNILKGKQTPGVTRDLVDSVQGFSWNVAKVWLVMHSSRVRGKINKSYFLSECRWITTQRCLLQYIPELIFWCCLVLETVVELV